MPNLGQSYNHPKEDGLPELDCCWMCFVQPSLEQSNAADFSFLGADQIASSVEMKEHCHINVFGAKHIIRLLVKQ